jgi:hypothetical protein
MNSAVNKNLQYSQKEILKSHVNTSYQTDTDIIGILVCVRLWAYKKKSIPVHSVAREQKYKQKAHLQGQVLD